MASETKKQLEAVLERIKEAIKNGDQTLLEKKLELENQIDGLDKQEFGNDKQEFGNGVHKLTPSTVSGAKQLETATIVGTVTGVKQVETATVVGTIGVAGVGLAKVTITSVLLEEPLVVPVSVANDDTASQVAGKIRTELGTIAAITDVFTISGATDKVILTNKVAAVNDATLSIVIDNDTCTGLTLSTSANTTSGTLGNGNASIVVTGVKITGSPITVAVAVTEGNNATTIAGKIRTALGLNTAITDIYTVGGTGNKVTLEDKVLDTNDSTLNINVGTGTALGITNVASSVNTVAGVAPYSGVTAQDGLLLVTAGEDTEGLVVDLPTGVIFDEHKLTIVKRDDSVNPVTIIPTGDDTIIGESSYVLEVQYDSVSLVYDFDTLTWIVTGKVVNV